MTDGTAKTGGVHVLVVDDSNDDLDRFRRIAAAHGWAVSTASSATQGLVAAQGPPVDLIVLDYDLGDGLGTDLSAAIRGLGIQTPILLQSGHIPAGNGHRAAALENVLNKNSPDYTTELVARVGTLLAPPLPASEDGKARPPVPWAGLHELMTTLVSGADPFPCAALRVQHVDPIALHVVATGGARDSVVADVLRVAQRLGELEPTLQRLRARFTMIDLENTTVGVAPIPQVGALVAASSGQDLGTPERKRLMAVGESIGRLVGATRIVETGR